VTRLLELDLLRKKAAECFDLAQQLDNVVQRSFVIWQARKLVEAVQHFENEIDREKRAEKREART
jgi:hypothetical protein